MIVMFDDDVSFAILLATLAWPIQLALVRARAMYIPKDKDKDKDGKGGQAEADARMEKTETESEDKVISTGNAAQTNATEKTGTIESSDKGTAKAEATAMEPTQPTDQTHTTDKPEMKAKHNNLEPKERPSAFAILRRTKATDGWLALYRGYPLSILCFVAVYATERLLLALLPPTIYTILLTMLVHHILECVSQLVEVRACTAPALRSWDPRTWARLFPDARDLPRTLWALHGVAMQLQALCGLGSVICYVILPRDGGSAARVLVYRIFLILSTAAAGPISVAMVRVSAYPGPKEDEDVPAGGASMAVPLRPAYLPRYTPSNWYNIIRAEEGPGALYAGWGWTALWKATEPFGFSAM